MGALLKQVHFKRHFLKSLFLLFAFSLSLNAQLAKPLSKDDVRTWVRDTKSQQPGVRSQAFHLLKQNTSDVADLLIALLQEDKNDIKSDVADVLKVLGPPGKKAIPALILLLGNGNGSIRTSAAVALGEMRPESTAAVPVLIELLKNKNAEIRTDSALALAILGEDAADAIPSLIEALKDPNEEVRMNAARAFWSKGEKGKAALQPLLKTLDDKNLEVRLNSAVALARMGLFQKVFPLVLRELHQKKNEPRVKALEAFGHMGPAAEGAMPHLLKAADDPNQEVCHQALVALAKVGGSSPEVVHALIRVREKGRVENLRWLFKIMGVPAWPALLQALKASEGPLRIELEEAFYETSEAAVSFFQTVYKEKDPVYRSWAVEKLGGLAPQFDSAAATLMDALNDPDFYVRWSAYEALRKLGPANKKNRDAFVKGLANPDVVSRYRFLCLLRAGGKEAMPDAVSALGPLLSDVDTSVRYTAALTLYESGNTEAFQKVASALKDPFLISRLNTRPGRALFLDRPTTSTAAVTSTLQIAVKDFFEFYDRDYVRVQIPSIKLSTLLEGRINNGLKTGDRLWVWTKDQEKEFSCDALEIPEGDLSPFTKVQIHLREGPTRTLSRSMDKARLISRYPISISQTWKIKEAGGQDVKFATEAAEKRSGEILRHPHYERPDNSEPLPVWTTLSTKVIETEKSGDFLITEFDTNKSIEFLHFHTMVFWRPSNGSQEWRQIAGFDTQGTKPAADVDGDGVPELYGSTEYQAAVLWKFFPQLEILATQSQ